jgi:hypothetical protein
LSRTEKLIEKAQTNPKNLRFSELCLICKHFGMESRKSGSSHVCYKRSISPRFTVTIQNVNGMAKPYQVKQLLGQLEKYGLLK